MNATELSNTILIVDDNDDDVYALRRALKKAAVANPQQVATHGEEAIDYLSGKGRFAERMQFPLPFLMFLDLKMPFLDGFDVLAWIRGRPELNGIAVVILTGSDEVKDHQRACALGARSYLVKPTQPADLQAVLRAMESPGARESGAGPVANVARGA